MKKFLLLVSIMLTQPASQLFSFKPSETSNGQHPHQNIFNCIDATRRAYSCIDSLARHLQQISMNYEILLDPMFSDEPSEIIDHLRYFFSFYYHTYKMAIGNAHNIPLDNTGLNHWLAAKPERIKLCALSVRFLFSDLQQDSVTPTSNFCNRLVDTLEELQAMACWPLFSPKQQRKIKEDVLLAVGHACLAQTKPHREIIIDYVDFARIIFSDIDFLITSLNLDTQTNRMQYAPLWENLSGATPKETIDFVNVLFGIFYKGMASIRLHQTAEVFNWCVPQGFHDEIDSNGNTQPVFSCSILYPEVATTGEYTMRQFMTKLSPLLSETVILLAVEHWKTDKISFDAHEWIPVIYSRLHPEHTLKEWYDLMPRHHPKKHVELSSSSSESESDEAEEDND